jgi:hypothetical protein
MLKRFGHYQIQNQKIDLFGVYGIGQMKFRYEVGWDLDAILQTYRQGFANDMEPLH